MTALEAWSIVAPIIMEHMARISRDDDVKLTVLDEAYVRVFGACVRQDERERSEDDGT